MAEAPSTTPIPPPPQQHPRAKSPLKIPTEPQTPSGVKTEPPSTPAAAAGEAAEIVSYTITIPSCSAWFSTDEIHETEKRTLPEFFTSSSSSSSRNPNSYKHIRNSIISHFRSNPTKKLSFTEARKTLLGDVGSIRRIFDFAEEWGLINHAPSVRKWRDKREEEMEGKLAMERKEKEEGFMKRTCTGCLSVCSLACFTTDKADITLCARCFVRSNYQRPGLSSSDFRRVDLSEEGARAEWSEKETLHLLEAVSHYGEDWKKVSEYVASRSEKDCLARFVRLRFGEQFLGEGQNGNFDQDEEENNAKRQKLSPLADASNPIMAQVAFLTAIVGPRVSEAAARAAVNALSDYNNENITNLKDGKEEDLIKKAELEIEEEEQGVERSLSEIIDIQMKEIKNKIEKFEEMEFLMEKEKLQIESIKDMVLMDQLALAQNQQKGKGENNVTWHKFRAIGDVIDKGTTILL
ncbi:hypothetical protein LUZ60_011738 [Juncus effusus]|nr:hypothetical protein LUZ60_011738 [Juncus effusus]